MLIVLELEHGLPLMEIMGASACSVDKAQTLHKIGIVQGAGAGVPGV